MHRAQQVFPRSPRALRETSSRSPFRIGIAWQGNPHHKKDRQRSIPLTKFAVLVRIPGVELFSLRKGPGVEQLRGIAGRFAVVELHGEVDAGAGAFMDTAAIMQHLNLVITSDTAIAHLAGTLGRENREKIVTLYGKHSS